MLGKDFFKRDVVEVSKDLLGCFLFREIDGLEVVGKIVEVEAYCGEDDPACHAFNGMTDRNEVMYGEAGFAYVYLIYGVHELLNFVCNLEGVPEAVLVRAVEPKRGISFMEENRGDVGFCELTDGPGKLTDAFGISLEDNGVDVTDDGTNLSVLRGGEVDDDLVERDERIGVSDDSLLRFYLKNNDFVSVK